MEVEIGVGLIRLADPNRGGDLLERIHRIRQNVAGEIGIILPKVRIRDNFRLDQQQYRIKIADMPVADGHVEPGMLLAMDSGMTTGKVAGHRHARTRPSAPRRSGSTPRVREQAEMYGYTVVEPGAVIATHLTETIRKHADEILTRDATKHLLDELKKTSPAVVEELIPGLMKLAEVQQILQMLLREQVPIRQLGADPRDARRLRRPHQGPDPARRNWSGAGWRGRSPRATATRAAGCTSSRSTRRWKIASAPASSTTSAGCSSACRRRRSRPPAG